MQKFFEEMNTPGISFRPHVEHLETISRYINSCRTLSQLKVAERILNIEF